MITVLLIVHGLLAVTLLGAITHQALSVVPPSSPGKRSFFARFRNVNSAAYADNLGVVCMPSRRSQLEMPFDVVSMREMGKGISGDAALTTVRFRSHVPVSSRERGKSLKGK